MFDFDLDAIQVMHDAEFEQLSEAVNREIVKNSKEIDFEEVEDISSRDFNTSPNYDSFAMNNRAFRESGRNASDRAIAHARERKHPTRDPFANEGQQPSLKQLDRNHSLVTDDRRSFRELRKNAIDNAKNARLLESQKSFRETRKRLAISLDHVNGRSVFHHQRLNDLLKQENWGDHLMRKYDNVRIENEKSPKRSSLDRPAKIMLQRKPYSNDSRMPIFPISDLSPESGFCDESPQSNRAEFRLSTREMKNVDGILDRENSSSSESNLSRKNVASDTDNPKVCVKYYAVETSNYKSNDVQDIENTIVLHSSSSCKSFSDDNDILVKEKEENIDDSKKPSLIIEEQSICGKDNIQNIDETFTREADSSLNIGASYKRVENIDLKEFDNIVAMKEPLINNNKIIAEKQNDEISKHDIYRVQI